MTEFGFLHGKRSSPSLGWVVVPSPCFWALHLPFVFGIKGGGGGGARGGDSSVAVSVETRILTLR